MTATLISATPSPYARKIRVALKEKDIPFTLQNEVPWDKDTKTPTYNPLERLPILIFEDGTAVYESHYILEYLEAKFPDRTPLLPTDVDQRLLARQIEVVVDGICDATRDMFFEEARGPEKMSQEWHARQSRKIQNGVKAVGEWAKQADGQDYLVGDKLSLADIAVVTLCGFMDMLNRPENPWKEKYPELKAYYEKLDERPSFKDTRPFMFEIKDAVV